MPVRDHDLPHLALAALLSDQVNPLSHLLDTMFSSVLSAVSASVVASAANLGGPVDAALHILSHPDVRAPYATVLESASGAIQQAITARSTPTPLLAGVDTLLAAFSRQLDPLIDQIVSPLARMATHFAEVLEQAFAGDVGDFLRLYCCRDIDQDQMQALERLATTFARKWYVRGRRMHTALQMRADDEVTSPDEVKRRELMTAILLVVWNEMDRPQCVRLGTKWVCDNTGRKLAIMPRNLEIRNAYRWARRRTFAVAAASLLDVPSEEHIAGRIRQLSVEQHLAPGYSVSEIWHGADRSPVMSMYHSAGALALLTDTDADPLHLLIEREHRRDERTRQARQWQQLLAVATPAQIRLLACLRDQLRHGGNLRDAAAEIGISLGTAHVQIMRLRSTLRQLHAM